MSADSHFHMEGGSSSDTRDGELLLHFNIELPDLAVITVKLRHALASADF